MVMIRLLQLVFNQHHFSGNLISAQNIAAIASHKFFGFNIDQRQVQDISKFLNVFLGRKPL